MKASKYIQGSDGNLNLFTREKGEWYVDTGGNELESPARVIVCQWGGSKYWDSGYHAQTWADTPTNRRKAWRYFHAY